MPNVMTLEEANFAFEFAAHEIARVAFYAKKIDAAEYMVARNAMDAASNTWEVARAASSNPNPRPRAGEHHTKWRTPQ